MKTSGFLHLSFSAVAALGVTAALTFSAPAQIATSNLPPTVRIVAPANGTVFTIPMDIPIVADARDPNGFVATVQFFAGTNRLGFGSNRTGSNVSSNLFSLVWSNVPPGQHVLTAKATDNGGASSVSPPITITVLAAPPPQPVVTIRATDPYASEPCTALTVIDSGKFTVCRNRGTNIDLLVRYTIGGTASNGVDYLTISNAVVIPRGAWSADIVIAPRLDNAMEGIETVALRLEPLACIAIWPPPPDCYLVGQPSEAVVYIQDCPLTNRPPLVQIVQPPGGAAFRAPANIGIAADTVDPDGYVGKVEFFEGLNKIGEQNKYFIVPPTNGTHIPYEMMWSNVPPGHYVLTARATDNRGAAGVSAPVPIAVVTNVPPPITNVPPVVTIVATDPVAIEGTNCWGWPSVTNRWPTGTTNCVTLAPNSATPIWWFTNCGPKNAILTVRRAGNTNTELAVSYDLGGTAINGVDYDALPGVVRVPAGQRKADILIVPKEDRHTNALHPDWVKTVILRLTPVPLASNTPPPYVVGYPNRAGAVILDSDRPRLATTALPDRCFLLGTDAADGTWFRIEYSTDLVNWVSVCTNQVIQGAIHFVDPEAPEMPRRFYRALPEANPPPE
jgi:hypothetical protein